MRSWRAIPALVAVVGIFGLLVGPVGASGSDPAGVVSVAPCVVLDTTAGSGAFAGPVVPGVGLGIDFQVTGTLPAAQGGATGCAVPATASGAVVNVAAVDVTGIGNLRVFPEGGTASGGVVNYGLAAIENSNAVVVPLSATGALTVESNGASVDVVATVVGYLEPNGGLPYSPVEPCAVSDTRPGGSPAAPFAGVFVGTETRTIQVSGPISLNQGGGNGNCRVPVFADSVLVNLVAIGGSGKGTLGARPAGDSSAAPYVSYNALSPAMPNSNALILPLSASGKLDLYTQAGAAVNVHVRVVVLGYFDAAFGEDSYHPVSPCTAFDSRASQSPGPGFSGPYVGGEVRTMQITGTFTADQGGGNTDCEVPPGATSVLVNVVAIQSQRLGNLRAYATGASGSGGIVNFNAVGMNNSNAVIVPLSANGQLDIEANAGAAVGLAAVQVRGVVLGYFADPNPTLELEVSGPESYVSPLFEPASVPITINGTIIDPLGVGEVRMALQDLSDGSWLYPASPGLYWEPSAIYYWPITPDSPGEPSSTWSFDTLDPDAFPLLGSGSYMVYAHYYDANNNFVFDNFPIRTKLPTPPTGTLETPLAGAIVPDVVTLWGVADDEQGISAGTVMVRDVNSGEYLFQASPAALGWTPTPVAIPVVVLQDGFWWKDLNGPSMTGRTLEVIQLSLTDGAANTATIPLGTQFTVGSAISFPLVEIDVPGPTGLVPEPFVLQGVASDGSGIVDVEMQLLDSVNNLYFDGTSWTASPTWFDLNFQHPGFGNITWSFNGSTNPSWGSGLWEVRVRAFDAAGTLTTHAWVPFSSTDDTSPPVVTVTTPTSGSINAAPVTVSGSVTDNTGVASASAVVTDNGTGLYWDGSDWIATATALPLNLGAPLAGSTSLAGTVFDLPVGDDDGTGSYLLEVTATDLGGLTGTTAVLFEVDEVNPTVTITTPTPNQLFDNPPAVIKGGVTDSHAVGSTVQLQIRDQTTGRYWNGSSFVVGVQTVDAPVLLGSIWNLPVDLTGGLSEYRVKAFHDDSVGNSSQTGFVYFDVDHASPVVTITNPSPGESINSGSENLSGTATDDLEVATVEIRILDTTTGLYYSPVGYVASPFWLDAGPVAAVSHTWNAGAIDIDALGGRGEYQIQARATDLAGKVTNTGNVTFMTDDNIDPVATILSPGDDALLTDLTPALFGAASDNFEVVSIELELREDFSGASCGGGDTDYFNGTGFQSTLTTFVAPITSGAGTHAVGWAISPDLSSGCGDYKWKARATDGRGNIGPWSPLRKLRLDSTPPTVVVTMAGDAAVTDPGTITGSRADDRGSNQVDVTVSIYDSSAGQSWNGTSWVAGAQYIPTSESGSLWTYDLPSQAVLQRSGPFKVVAKGIDEAGREALSSPVNVSVVSTAVDLTYDSPTLFANRPVALTGTATDVDGIESVKIRIIELSGPSGSTSRYWTAAGWSAVGPADLLATTLAGSSQFADSWSYAFDPGPTGTGSYRIVTLQLRDDGAVNYSPPATNNIDFAIDASPPTISWDDSSPVAVLDGTSLLSGTKGDDQGAATVSVTLTVVDSATGDYWTGSSWSPSWLPVPVNVLGPSTWEYDLPSLATLGRPGPFTLTAEAKDAIGKTTVAVLDVVVLDPSREITITSPALFLGLPVNLAGTATDIDGIDTVTLKIVEVSSTGAITRYWTNSGWSGTGPATSFTTNLTESNPFEATWSYSFFPGEGTTGLFEIGEVRINQDDGGAFLPASARDVPFSFDLGSPLVLIQSPAGSALTGLGSHVFGGQVVTDTDLYGLFHQRIYHINRAEYWNGSGWQTTPHHFTVSVTAVDLGGGVWSWTRNIVFPETGEYHISYRARDSYNLSQGTDGGWSSDKYVKIIS